MAMPKDALHIKIVNVNAKIPTKRIPTSVEYDLSALESSLIPGRGKGRVRTGLIITPPSGMFVRLENRPDYAFRNHISIVTYNLNPTLHHELVVDVYNHGDSAVMIKRGHKFAIFMVIPRYEFNLPFVCELPDNVQVTPLLDGTECSLNAITQVFQEQHEEVNQ